MSAPRSPRVCALRYAGAATALVAAGAIVAIARDAAAGVVLLALAIAVLCTGLRHYLRKEPRP